MDKNNVLDKDIKTIHLTASQVVSNTPCWVFGIIVNEGGVTLLSLTLRNGNVVGSPIKLKFGVCLYFQSISSWNYPLYFSKGLYAELEAGLDNATIQYKQEY